MGNSILLPGPEHPGKIARILGKLELIRNLSGGTKKGAGLINLLCPYCPNHNILKFLTKLNNAHTISFVLASFLLLIHHQPVPDDSMWGSPASLFLMIQCEEITELLLLRPQAQGSVWASTAWQWWLQVWKNKHQIHKDSQRSSWRGGIPEYHRFRALWLLICILVGKSILVGNLVTHSWNSFLSYSSDSPFESYT